MLQVKQLEDISNNKDDAYIHYPKGIGVLRIWNINTELIVRIELTFVEYKTTVITIILYKQMWTERESNPYNLNANQI